MLHYHINEVPLTKTLLNLLVLLKGVCTLLEVVNVMSIT